MTSANRLLAEAIGTFWIVFAGCGAAVLGSAFPHLGIGVYGVSIAFGLTVVTMLYAIGHVSGGHLNPAVSIGLMIAKRFPAREVPGYIVILGAAGVCPSGNWPGRGADQLGRHPGHE